MKTTGTWISVKTPPKNSKDVLVTEGTACAIGFYREKKWNFYYDIMEEIVITHWMKLPPLPRSYEKD